jgi:hypothetical protein
MNISELLGAIVQTGMSPSSNERIKNSLGGGSGLDSLSSMLEKSSGQGSGGGIGDLISNVLGSNKGGGGIGGLLSGMLGGGRRDADSTGPGGGIGDVLSGMLGDAGKRSAGEKILLWGAWERLWRIDGRRRKIRRRSCGRRFDGSSRRLGF